MNSKFISFSATAAARKVHTTRYNDGCISSYRYQQQLQQLSVDIAAITTTDAAATTEGSYLMQLCCLLAALRCGLCWYFVKIFHWFSTFLWLFSLLPCGARCCMRISPQKSNGNCVKIVCVKYLIESNNINWECLFAWQTFNLATITALNENRKQAGKTPLTIINWGTLWFVFPKQL